MSGFVRNIDAVAGRSVFSDLTSAFTSAASGKPDDTAPQATMLESLGVNIQVNVAPLSQHIVSNHQQNAASLVKPNTQAVTSVQADITSAKAQVSDAIRTAQKQVVAAAEASGVDVGALYPNARTNESGIMAQALMGSDMFEGLGSMATALKHGPDVMTIAEDMKAAPNRKEAEALIKDKLIQASSSPKAAFGDTNAFKAEPEMGKSQFDWEKFFDDGHELGDLMLLDPDNPSPDIVPEFAALDAIDNEADEVLAVLDHVREEKRDEPVLAEQQKLTAAEIDFNVKSMLEIRGLTPKPSDANALKESEAREDVLATLKQQMEPDPYKLAFNRSMSPGVAV